MRGQLIQSALLALSITCAGASGAVITLTSNSGWQQSLNNGVTWGAAEATSTLYAPGGQSMPALWPSGVGESTPVLYRLSFFLSGTPVAGTLWVAQDDDGFFKVNGTTVFTDDDGQAQGYGPFNIAGLLSPGINTFEASVRSVWCCGRGFAAYAVIETQDGGGEVIPEPSSVAMWLTGLGACGWLGRRRRARA